MLRMTLQGVIIIMLVAMTRMIPMMAATAGASCIVYGLNGTNKAPSDYELDRSIRDATWSDCMKKRIVLFIPYVTRKLRIVEVLKRVHASTTYVMVKQSLHWMKC